MTVLPVKHPTQKQRKNDKDRNSHTQQGSLTRVQTPKLKGHKHTYCIIRNKITIAKFL